MKSYKLFTLPIAAALLFSRAVFAADDNPNTNPNDKKFQKKVTQQPVTKTAVKPVVTQKTQQPGTYHKTVVNPAYTKQNTRPVNQTVVTQNNPQVVQQKNTTRNFRGNTGAAPAAANAQYTRANNYGGRWVSGANFHPEWNHGQEYYFNNHHYRWYDGGWLIVDGGFWPVPTVGVYAGGSLMAGAQQQLANLGYYNGPIDGVAGPGTRAAIEHYQVDNNLPASGHLNEPTRESLGLEQ